MEPKAPTLEEVRAAVGRRLVSECVNCRSEPASLRALADLANAYRGLEEARHRMELEDIEHNITRT